VSTLANITAADGFFIGEDKSLVYTITAGGASVNISGWTIQWALSATQGGAPVLTKTASLTTPTSGICTVVLASADTLSLNTATTTDYFYRLRRTDTGSRSELAYGSVDLQGLYVT
jgi:hypothetical protein